MRAPLAVQGPPTAAVNCEAARRGLADLLGGPVPLTEWALLESHLMRCARCRRLEARLRQLVAASQPVTSSQRVVTLARAFTPRAKAGAMWTLDLAVRCAGGLTARMRTSLAIPRRASVAAVDAVEAGRRAISRSARRAIRSGPSARTVGTMLALALTVCALPGTDGSRQRALPPAPPSAGLAPAQLEAAWIESRQPEPARLRPAEAVPVRQVPSPPAPAIEKRTVSVGLPRTDPRRHAPLEVSPRAAAPSPRDVSAPSPSDVSASEPGAEATSSPPALGAELPVAASHVVGRLTAKNPRAAQRDFIALLADVGGTELGRNHRITFTSVEVVVPQSRYGEFADGLARIGSWQLEAARSPLPDAVHMTIHLTD